jgi:glucose/arabinose dehydrogenase
MSRKQTIWTYVVLAAGIALLWVCYYAVTPTARAASQVLEGKAAFTDYTGEKPGVVRRIRVGDLPKPFETPSANNGPRIVPRPADAWPQTLPGFSVGLYAEGLQNPRMIRTAPNGDLFLAESGPGRIRVFRGITAEGKPQNVEVFAEGLNRPFGIAFYPPGPNPQWVYVANTGSVVRFPYRNGDLKARGAAETIVPSLPAGGGHWTRDIAFSLDGKTMFVSVGSRSNVDDPDTTPAETNRATVLAFAPDGSGMRVYAYGIRNAVGIAVHPQSGELWVSVNERDGLGDDLVPEYITHVQEGGFYGWPWFYLGPNYDPRHVGKRPDLREKVIVPDVLLQAHLASLGMVFYDGRMFPAQYRGGIFAAEHGSWNRTRRVGYKIIFVPMKGTRATGEYMDFVTGFVASDTSVWGRPVAVAVAKDGSLIFSDDGSGSLWRVTYGK